MFGAEKNDKEKARRQTNDGEEEKLIGVSFFEKA